jgi:mRNA interferase RelE/StbE
MFLIVFKKSAEKELEKLPIAVTKKIAIAIDELAYNPRPKLSKKLEAQKAELWRIRVGDYRIIYLIEDEIKIVEIRKVGHRKDIYR